MLQEIANSSSRFTLQLPHSSSSLPSPTLLTHAAAQSLHTCTTPVPWRAPSSPAISLFQRNPYPPGAEELRYLECKRAIFPLPSGTTAGSIISLAIWGKGNIHKTLSEQTNKQKKREHFTLQTKTKTRAQKYITDPLSVHTLIQAVLLLLIRMRQANNLL